MLSFFEGFPNINTQKNKTQAIEHNQFGCSQDFFRGSYLTLITSHQTSMNFYFCENPRKVNVKDRTIFKQVPCNSV